MDTSLYHQLDNPAWSALTGPQQSFATGFEFVSRYRKENLPFAAYDHAHPEQLPLLDRLLQPGEVFFLIGDIPALPAGWRILNELPCLQMINPGAVPSMPEPVEIIPLTSEHRDEMYQLVQKVQPGYYEPDTHRLGNYFGIRQEGKLVAMAGERMRVPGMSELSAICTDPGYTGRKYAQHLIVALCHSNQAKGIIPFLHVLETNIRAVSLYEFMGFETRRVILFRKIQKR